jgi:hypothetical protein
MCVQDVRLESGMWCSTRGSMVLAVSWTPPFWSQHCINPIYFDVDVTLCYINFKSTLEKSRLNIVKYIIRNQIHTNSICDLCPIQPFLWLLSQLSFIESVKNDL